MKISCLPVGMYPQFVKEQVTILQWMDAGEKMGLDGIDISCQFFRGHVPTRIEEEVKKIRHHHIPIVMVADYTDFTVDDQTQIERNMAYIARDIALASEYGAKYVRVLAGQQHDGLNTDAAVDSVVRNLIRASEIAQKFGITLVYENDTHPSAWKKPDFSMNPGIFLKVVECLRGSLVRVNFDTANVIACEGDPMEMLQKVIDMVDTLHIADTSTFGKLTPTSVGTGLVPLREIFSVLKQNGFDGYLCIEAGVETEFGEIHKMVDRVRNILALA